MYIRNWHNIVNQQKKKNEGDSFKMYIYMKPSWCKLWRSHNFISQLYLNKTEVQKEEGEGKAAWIDPPKQGDEPREKGNMGSREQEIPHRKESCQARELRVGLGRSCQGDTVDSQLSQHSWWVEFLSSVPKFRNVCLIGT